MEVPRGTVGEPSPCSPPFEPPRCVRKRLALGTLSLSLCAVCLSAYSWIAICMSMSVNVYVPMHACNASLDSTC